MTVLCNVHKIIPVTEQYIKTLSMSTWYRDAHHSKLYDMIHIDILIYDTVTLMILITILQCTS